MLAVDDDAAADARPPEDPEKGGEAAPRPEAALGLDRDVDVVADRDRTRELL